MSYRPSSGESGSPAYHSISVQTIRYIVVDYDNRDRGLLAMQNVGTDVVDALRRAVDTTRLAYEGLANWDKGIDLVEMNDLLYASIAKTEDAFMEAPEALERAFTETGLTRLYMDILASVGRDALDVLLAPTVSHPC